MQKRTEMKKILFISLFCIFLFSCGKKSAPIYKSKNHIENIIIS
jgi:hypothetical protein